MQSGLIYTYKVFDFHSADRAFFQVLATFYTGSIVLARKIHAVLILITANHARIRMSLLTHQGHFYLADICLIRSDFEDSLISNFEQFAGFALHGQSLPCTIGSAHILNIVLSIAVANRGMDVAEMLVIREVEEIIRLPSYRYFTLLWYL